MSLNKLISIKTTKAAKRVGRGLASGKGEKAGRGHKGQKSRSGYNIPRSFEGGQTPLIQRLAKARGFHSIHAKPEIVHIKDIEKNYADGEVVNFKSLIDKKMVHSVKSGIKVVGPGELTKKLRFLDVRLTKKLLEQVKANPVVKSATILPKKIAPKTPSKKVIASRQPAAKQSKSEIKPTLKSATKTKKVK